MDTYQYGVAGNEVDYLLADLCCGLVDTAQLKLMGNASEHTVAISRDFVHLQTGHAASRRLADERSETINKV
jgi:hypothetical protein